MGEQAKENNHIKRLCVGLLAHVDAGKTTLSEGILYQSGNVRKMGRVDHGNAFLDTYEMERARGITIFSKQAEIKLENMIITLLDTPGHVDFSAEMERTLQVLDYAILVISGADGVQGHTQTLWRLLKKYNIPVFIFINKMDQMGTNKDSLLCELKKKLDEYCIDFSDTEKEIFYENLAMCREDILEDFLDTGIVEDEVIRSLIYERRAFPCFFGSALKLQGISEILEAVEKYTCKPEYPQEFGAKVFKISRDEQGSRLTYMKITGGSLRVRSAVSDTNEKVTQIRVYSGAKYEVLNEAEAGCVCAVTGLNNTRIGEGLGIEKSGEQPVLKPVLTYKLILPSNCTAAVMMPKLKQLEEEEPLLHILWDEDVQEIQIQLMGEVQTEVLKSIIWERFGTEVEFGAGSIVYKETISSIVEGVGHFEPLRHYAEVHVILEPGEQGSGVRLFTDCSEDDLDRNWQRLILTHLGEREHKGVLTGSAITDIKITLVAGRGHQKHTEGGDFRQAAYRAVRQGLMQAESVLLEPYYDFRLEIPEKMVGRAMSDMEKMNGVFELPRQEGDMSILTGYAPVINIGGYQKEVTAYTKGHGNLFLTVRGYEPCCNAEEVIGKIGYNPENDLDNSANSIFCSHGAGFMVSWDKVKEYMHVESKLGDYTGMPASKSPETYAPTFSSNDFIDEKEIDAIFRRTFYANQKDKNVVRRHAANKTVNTVVPSFTKTWKKTEPQEEYLLVDGYNIIFAWDELKELAEVSIDGARGRLLDILCGYQAAKECHLYVVFDAYKVKGHPTEIVDYNNIHVVYTKEAETADQYIEKFAYKHGEKYSVTVATSDGLEQLIIRGHGCALLSARELKEDIEQTREKIRREYLKVQPKGKTSLGDMISRETAEKMENLHLTDGQE